MNTCPIGRCPITKPASALLPNYALLQEVELQGGGGLVEMMENLRLPPGAQRFVLDASDIQLVEVISTVGATSAVWKGMFEGNEVRRVACHCRGGMHECESANRHVGIPVVAFMHANPQVAVKVLNLPDGAPDNDPGVASLRRELVVLFKAAQHCQHVCRYHGVARKGNMFMIVMMRYPSSLAAFIRSAPGVERESVNKASPCSMTDL